MTKKIITVLLLTVSVIVVVVVSVFLKKQIDIIMDDDPAYVIKGYFKAKEEFDDEGFMDYIDYCEYHYKPTFDKRFEDSKIYKKVDSRSLVEKLENYARDFPAEYIRKIEYNFFSDIIQEGDYYILINDEPEINEFKLYYYSVDRHILYYLNNT